MGRLMEGKSARKADGTARIKQLRPWHESMARSYVSGKKPGELALLFGMSPSQISVILGTPLFIAEVERLRAVSEYKALDMKTELEIRQGVSLEAIDRGLNSPDTALAVKTGFDVLDRTGYGKNAAPQKSLHLHAHVNVKDMSDEELAREALDLVGEG